MQTFDPRSERNLATLVPAAQAAARKFMAEATARMEEYGLAVRIIGGTRTYAEQNALYAQGRSAPGPVVTNARGGFSNHNFGIAWDIGLFEGTKYLEESRYYETCALIGLSQGLDCGAFWKFEDGPHYQLNTGLNTTQLRNRIAKGLPVV